MAKRKIEIFNISFLDLLSGALAAVIILFVVVPKLDSSSKEAKEALEALNLEANQLEGLIEELEQSIDSEVFEALQNNMNDLQQAMEQTNERVRQLENQKNTLEQERYQLMENLTQSNEQVHRLQAESKEQAEELAKSKLFGIEAEVAIVFSWEDDVDIDLYLNKEGTDEWCWYSNISTSFALLLKDIRSATGNGYEMMYQQELVPGQYNIYLNVYSEQNAGEVIETTGFVEIYPFSDRQQRLDFGTISLQYVGGDANQPGKGTFVRTITITESGIE